MSQQWKFVSTSGGYYKLVNRNSGKLADVNQASQANGTGLIQYFDNGGTNQQWQLVKVN